MCVIIANIFITNSVYKTCLGDDWFRNKQNLKTRILDLLYSYVLLVITTDSFRYGNKNANDLKLMSLATFQIHDYCKSKYCLWVDYHVTI